MLEVSHLQKKYQEQPLLKDISFTLEDGEAICLLGASGSGKSTILRIIAGLENQDAGEVRWNGKNLGSTAAHQRNFGLMFQDYALFPHLSVFENIAFGLHLQKKHAEETAGRVDEVLKLVNLPGFEKRRVTELSGGEQQRVALARALAPHPELLMLDEPLGALDRALREKLMRELREILQKSGIPTIYVTHDQEEAFTIADKIVLLHSGEVEQAGSPENVFWSPRSEWVAAFLGLGNIISGVSTGKGVRWAFGEIPLETGRSPGEKVTLLLRPPASLVEEGGTLSGVVIDVIFRGTQFRVELSNGLHFLTPEAPRTGQRINLQIQRMEVL